MPQMAPLSWMNLFIMFSTIFIIMNSLNFFSFHYQISKKVSKKSKQMNNWKW